MIPTTETAKQLAKRLRADLARKGTPVGHSQSLEMVAHQFGQADWNTLVALAPSETTNGSTQKAPPSIGDRVTGTYLGQRFTASVHSVKTMDENGALRLALQLDEPVDVVTFDSFSNYRSRIQGTVDAQGISPQRISDGTPQLVVEW